MRMIPIFENGNFFEFGRILLRFFGIYFSTRRCLSSDFLAGVLRLLPLILPSSMRSVPYSSIRTLMQPAIGMEIMAPARPKV